MASVLHGSARTTPCLRAEFQASQESTRSLAARYGLNPNSAADANGDFDHTGYTNIEKYINGLIDGSYP